MMVGKVGSEVVRVRARMRQGKTKTTPFYQASWRTKMGDQSQMQRGGLFAEQLSPFLNNFSLSTGPPTPGDMQLSISEMSSSINWRANTPGSDFAKDVGKR
jgi:hypothetical protein